MIKIHKIVLLLLLPISINSTSKLEETFTDIYNNNKWANKETVSGDGSTLHQTQTIRSLLPKILKELNIEILLDAPCGDFNWMQKIDLTFLSLYVGIDIVQDIIKKNSMKYANDKIVFYHLDISKHSLPNADLIFCRDLFLHLTYEHIFNILKNFKKSAAEYILVSTYPNAKKNFDRDKVDQHCRPVNLELPPFNFPKPLMLIEDYKRQGKYIGLWRLDALPTTFD